jgi:hypothetical protein
LHNLTLINLIVSRFLGTRGSIIRYFFLLNKLPIKDVPRLFLIQRFSFKKEHLQSSYHRNVCMDSLGTGRGFLGIREAHFGSNTSVARAESQAPIRVGFAVDEEAMESFIF